MQRWHVCIVVLVVDDTGLQRWYFCIVEQGVDDKDPYASKGVVCIVELGVDDNDAYPPEVVCVHCGAGC